jgi:hypothetical protein
MWVFVPKVFLNLGNVKYATYFESLTADISGLET